MGQRDLCKRLALASGAHAQGVAEFYKGKSIEIYIGTSAGGGYDAYGRLIARHIGKHIPGNPMSSRRTCRAAAGCGSPTTSTTPRPRRDRDRDIQPRRPVRSVARQQTGPVRRHQFNWIGSTNDEICICVAWHTSGFSNAKRCCDPRARRRRQRPIRRHLSIPQDRQWRARDQIQGHHRLSRRQRHRYRNGAPGGAGPLRLVMDEREGHAAHWLGKEDHHPVPDGAGEAPRSAGRRP